MGSGYPDGKKWLLGKNRPTEKWLRAAVAGPGVGWEVLGEPVGSEPR